MKTIRICHIEATGEELAGEMLYTVIEQEVMIDKEPGRTFHSFLNRVRQQYDRGVSPWWRDTKLTDYVKNYAVLYVSDGYVLSKEELMRAAVQHGRTL